MKPLPTSFKVSILSLINSSTGVNVRFSELYITYDVLDEDCFIGNTNSQ
jgi:hypothetical protein